ncbi:uncharacterized protein LOC143029599 isoform X2 [Oratosquilla oratoria]|uniref:uncharacterized protein LOC143029599 isoform X2 n=1 Tax=Oratosquilla oratoria TaxID=337810 RepID=UPI003F7580C7
MGGLTSKQVDEVVKASKTPKGTPEQTRVLPFDPRSPSDNVNRTPITVSKPQSDGLDSTPVNSTTKIQVMDPRSPSCELERTPVIVEGVQQRQRRNFSLKPSKLTQLENLDINEDEALDPRSPSSKVPRTPLEEKKFTDESSPDVGSQDSFQSCEVEEEASSSDEVIEDPKSCSDDTVDKARKPLQALQNTRNSATDTPRGLLQAKHCRSVEEEFNKNQKILMRQLSNKDNSITSATEFVENI